jgi:uncharacterized damage-inducible protein DinB
VRTADVLQDGFGRVHGIVHRIVDGLSPDELAARVDGRANSVGWLVWHLTRIQDDHVADASGLDQVWLASGWRDRFALPFDPGDTGYGHSDEQVGAVRVGSAELLTGYFDAVHEQTLRYVGTLTDADLDRVVDTAWTPPVTLGVRLVSVISDDLQHAGQAAFVRGLIRA